MAIPVVNDLEKQLRYERTLARLLKRVNRRLTEERGAALNAAQAARIISIPIVGVLTDKTTPEEFKEFAELIK